LALVFAESAVSGSATAVPHAATGIGAWSIVVASAIYTYDGWTYAAYFSGEIKGGGGAVARACIKGTVIVILLYVFLVSALAWKAPLTSLAGNELALAGALEMVVSPLASTVVLVTAIIMLLAHQNLLYMSSPRILQALAVDGLAVRRAGEISKGGNPIFAVVLIVGVIILRSRQPDADRPYRAWGHPWSTYACLLGWVLISVFQAVAEIHTAVYAAIMVAVAWPVYRFLVRTGSNGPGVKDTA
jgi:APA family basic amino acid/polyamine antiporter